MKRFATLSITCLLGLAILNGCSCCTPRGTVQKEKVTGEIKKAKYSANKETEKDKKKHKAQAKTTCNGSTCEVKAAPSCRNCPEQKKHIDAAKKEKEHKDKEHKTEKKLTFSGTESVETNEVSAS